jgi:hypothetical protein
MYDLAVISLSFLSVSSMRKLIYLPGNSRLVMSVVSMDSTS